MMKVDLKVNEETVEVTVVFGDHTDIFMPWDSVISEY